MDFFAACYRQQGEESASVLLQQYQYRQMEVVFACVCGADRGGAGSYMTERLLAWFRGLDLGRLARSRERQADRVQAKLAEAIEEIDRELLERRLSGKGVWSGKGEPEKALPEGELSGKELPRKELLWEELSEKGQMEKRQLEKEKVGLAVFLCIEDIYIIFRRGRTGICLINTTFGRVCLRRIGTRAEKSGMAMELGRLQADVGLLLGTESFYRHIADSMIREGLSVREIYTEKQMERHLAELAGEAERRGGAGMGAILLRTVGHRGEECKDA